MTEATKLLLKLQLSFKCCWCCCGGADPVSRWLVFIYYACLIFLSHTFLCLAFFKVIKWAVCAYIWKSSAVKLTKTVVPYVMLYSFRYIAMLNALFTSALRTATGRWMDARLLWHVMCICYHFNFVDTNHQKIFRKQPAVAFYYFYFFSKSGIHKCVSSSTLFYCSFNLIFICSTLIFFALKGLSYLVLCVVDNFPTFLGISEKYNLRKAVFKCKKRAKYDCECPLC